MVKPKQAIRILKIYRDCIIAKCSGGCKTYKLWVSTESLSEAVDTLEYTVRHPILSRIIPYTKMDEERDD